MDSGIHYIYELQRDISIQGYIYWLQEDTGDTGIHIWGYRGFYAYRNTYMGFMGYRDTYIGYRGYRDTLQIWAIGQNI